MRLFLRLFRLQLLIPSWDYDSFHLTITSCWLRRDTIGQCLLFSLNTVIRRIPGRFQLKLFWTPSPSVGGQFITRKSIHLQTQFSCHLHMFANRETQGEEEKRIQSRRREFTWRWKFSCFSFFRERNRHFLPLPIIIPSYCLLIHSSQFNCHEGDNLMTILNKGHAWVDICPFDFLWSLLFVSHVGDWLWWSFPSISTLIQTITLIPLWPLRIFEWRLWTQHSSGSH